MPNSVLKYIYVPIMSKILLLLSPGRERMGGGSSSDVMCALFEKENSVLYTGIAFLNIRIA